MNIGKVVVETLEFSQQLDILHKHITRNDLPVQKSDSFDKQCFLLERYIGEDIFQSTYKKMKTVNILSGVIALPVLLVIVVAYIYSRWIDRKYDIFGLFLNNPILYIIPAVLIVVTLVLALFHALLRKKLYYWIYPELKSKLKVNDE
ncbi:DUF6097 family protein [Paenibacillus alvei]|uniref:Uncharacterized protein n=1 Tax=Paenibacillus alvei TaxID=44250 RepID=A0A383RA67_PAEAL|nr:DUF6097 family protein [Paenibacillus alvei]SYX84057.1 conserved protein of unknown function [Paenibacillus alvei]